MARRRYWTHDEEETLRRRYATATPLELVRLLGRPWYSIRVKARALGLHRPRVQPIPIRRRS